MEHSNSSPYYISLEKYNNDPIDIFRCDYNSGIEIVKNEEHNICFHGSSGTENGLFISKLFANSEGDALKKAF